LRLTTGPHTACPALIYFDHNATHPLSPAARQAWLDAVERFPGNPSSPHRLGERADRALNEARERLAEWLNCRPDEITWTSGATESVNAALADLAGRVEGQVLVSAIEHPCVLEASRRYFPDGHRLIPVTPQGVVELQWIEERLASREVAAVIVMAANNETGVLQPWEKIAEICKARHLPFLCDAAQWVGRMPLTGLGSCEYVTGCAHKFGGPPGVGFLKHPGSLRPFIVGGPQEEGRRAGTENLPGVLAMTAALAEIVGRLPANNEPRETFESALCKALPGVRILGAKAPRLWNTTSAMMPEQRDCRQRWVVKLDKVGFAVSTGSACASGKEETSHVLRAMGHSAEESSRVLRFSAGWNTTSQDWQALLEGIVRAAAELT
jgi:cysteine desulfurase